MIEEWRNDFISQHKKNKNLSSDELEEILNKQPWFKSAEEYSILFEKIYDLPAQRRDYIENRLSDASPSWGYIYLVNLLQNGLFNTVFTVNFDDLLNEACYLFSDDVRPIVCAHDSSIKSIRITSKRPKIIKLHGDFLFDNIKNTLGELESLEDNMREKFKQYSCEYGLIVIGYSGRDKSIMDILSTLLKYDKMFPHGIYWCFVGDFDLIDDKVKGFMKFPKFKLVRIKGFDEFFAELHEYMGYELQQQMANPYGALAKRLNRLMDKAKIKADGSTHPIIDKDIAQIGKHIEKIQISGKKNIVPVENASSVHLDIGDGSILEMPIPFGMLARIKEKEGNIELAIKYGMKELKGHPKVEDFIYLANIATKYKQLSIIKEFLVILFQNETLFKERSSATFDMVLRFIDIGEYDTANKILDFGYEAYSKYGAKNDWFEQYFYLNKLQIKKYKKESYTGAEEKLLSSFKADFNPLIRMGASILLDDIPSAEKFMKEAIFLGREKWESLKTWPIVKLAVDNITDSEIRANLGL